MKIEPEPQDFDADEVRAKGIGALLEEGAALFDAGRYEEAHERFEALWLASEGAGTDFFKGLIQVAISLHHFERQNLEGARKLHSGSRRLLAPFLPRHRGVDVEALLADMQAFLRPCLRARPGEQVPFERDAAPRMRRSLPDAAEAGASD